MSILIGLFFSVGIGTDVNIFFDVYFSLAILVGCIISENKKILRVILIQILIFLGLRLLQNTIYTSLPSEITHAKQEIALIKSVPGNALCEHIELCYFAGKKFLYDPYSVYERIATKTISEEKILILLKNHTFSLVQLNNPHSEKQGRFTSSFDSELKKNYHLYQNLYIAN